MVAASIGVVAIGRNEGRRLIACLESVKSQTDSIVYVDSGSVDGSQRVAGQLGAVVVDLDMTLPFTAARARNAGFAVMKRLRPELRFVQFIDGDCILAQSWLSAALTFMNQRADVAVVCGRRREQHPDETVFNHLADIEWDTPVGEALACGGDALVRVEAFESVEGYRPELIAGEEPEMCLRLRERGWKIWRIDADMTFHDAALQRFGQWWLRAVRCGYAYAEVSRLHRTSPCAIWRMETRRASLWAGLVPLCILIGAVVHPIILALTLIYPIQIIRIAVRRGPHLKQSWSYGLFATIGKFAELQGIATFLWRSLRRKDTVLIEYK